jgi:ABC-2 type transport system permease protein
VGTVTHVSPSRPLRTPGQVYRQTLWLLTRRDLKVRYATSFLGYLWSILDPLVMALIYWFVFTQIVDRSIGEAPYIVFLLAGLLPWTWFTSAVGDSTRAFTKDAKLVRSTRLPRSVWVARIVLSKGIEFVFALPVIAVFAIIAGAELTWGVLWLPVAVAIQTALTLGLGLMIAPLVVFFRDLERAVRLVLRFLFYASPIVYGLSDLPAGLSGWAAANPLAGIVSLYRASFFPDQVQVVPVVLAAAISLAILGLGSLVFRRTVHAVLKEI